MEILECICLVIYGKRQCITNIRYKHIYNALYQQCVCVVCRASVLDFWIHTHTSIVKKKKSNH